MHIYLLTYLRLAFSSTKSILLQNRELKFFFSHVLDTKRKHNSFLITNFEAINRKHFVFHRLPDPDFQYVLLRKTYSRIFIIFTRLIVKVDFFYNQLSSQFCGYAHLAFRQITCIQASLTSNVMFFFSVGHKLQ